jgi:asparagine synthase (glutamine-hydrolysing)
MCGIAGFINPKQFNADRMASIARLMGNSLIHRGPNDSGEWVDSASNIAIAHRRLSILDLTEAGHQPMHSRSGRYIMVFNGEIYNHLDLRYELDKSRDQKTIWSGHSDSETLLELFEEKGVLETLYKIEGMFAIALWDIKTQKLTLARDRIGEKPLYFGWVQGAFLFSSELKAMKQYPGFNNDIDRGSLAEYLKYSYVPAPMSIYKDISKLLPGHFVEISLVDSGIQINDSQAYWSLSNLILESQSNLIASKEECVETSELALESSVKSQMISDVPLGAFLSGGIDSSLIVSLMQKNSMRPIKTFTIGFDDGPFGYIGDESPYAKAVADHLGTDHHELIVSSLDAQQIIPKLAEIYDEPFADSSQIPTYLVSQLASKSVSVALSGDAGDEVFSGYYRYTLGAKFWNIASKIPYPLRNAIGTCIGSVSASTWTQAASLVNKPNFGEKIFKLGSNFKQIRDAEALYKRMVTVWHENNILKSPLLRESRLANDPGRLFSQLEGQILNDDLASKMMYADSLSYLPGDILCKVDRAAMSNSLETRVPFLNERVLKEAWRIPPRYKIGKQPLKDIAYKYVPRALIDRPKEGFGIPAAKWLRGPLREWAAQLLDENRIAKEGYFNADLINQIWAEHLSGATDWSSKLWTILMFQLWLENQQN